MSENLLVSFRQGSRLTDEPETRIEDYALPAVPRIGEHVHAVSGAKEVSGRVRAVDWEVSDRGNMRAWVVLDSKP